MEIDINKYSNNKELLMLMELAHEISNYQDGFKGKINHTFILGPAGSSCFGFEVRDNDVLLGVPEELFELFMGVRWYVANIIKDKPGLYLVFEMGIYPKNHPVALRIYTRTKRVNAILNFNKIIFVKMTNNGFSYHLTPKTSFEIPLKVVEGLDWEKISLNN